MKSDAIPRFSVEELNQSIGNLLSRGFAPRFFLHALVSKSQLKNGHLWLTLTDGEASISAVIWSSSLKDFSFHPKQEDGVEILGKLNFWKNRASLVVQVIQIRPTLSTVLRQFKIVSSLLIKEGLIDESRSRPLPKFPKSIAICTSVPSSAYADILRTAKERWPLTNLIVLPIPVQGDVSNKIQKVISNLANSYKKLSCEALILARGGGSREDLMVFDDENLCRELACFPIPVITGIGHEDDLTVADLVADHRSATPTSSIVDLLPSRQMELNQLLQYIQKSKDMINWIINKQSQLIIDKRKNLEEYSPLKLLRQKRILLSQRNQMLYILSPRNILKRGFSITRFNSNKSLKSIKDIKINDKIVVELIDGCIESSVTFISPIKDD